MSDGPDKPAKQRAPRRQSNRVRVEDVAAVAGVSGATVSRAINQAGPVSPKLRERIERAITQLGYVPNGAARALASHRTRAIGMIIPTLENANFAIAAEGAQHYLINAGYQMLVASSGYDPKQEWAHIQSLVGHGIDGIILVGAQRSEEVTDYLRSRRLPYVVTWSLADNNTPSVGFDNSEAARQLAKHLLDLGHRQVGVIAGLTKNNDRAAARLGGIRRAFRERGLEFPRELLIERPYRIAEGQLALRALWTMSPPPTAVICGNDQLAFGALIECYRQGIVVPDQLSIAGFDDLEFASQILPTLTTIHVPAEEIGRRAAAFLVDRLNGLASPMTTEVAVSLVVRGSSGPPPASAIADDAA
jgi:LacI family transcriptional regulator